MTLSIITVNLNNLEGLKRTYDSVVSQTFTDYEWLVIDGGSTDGSREFIEQHQDKFAYWCSEPDKGIYNAMNKGIVRAKGEYLNFMNSGDCFACEETLAGVFGVPRTADILYGYMMVGNIDGYYMPIRSMKQELLWYDLFTNTIPHQASFIRSKLFETVGLYDEQLKVVSDSKWFASAVLNYEASYEFMPYKIAIFEGGGTCLTIDCSSERAKQRKGTFPEYIREKDVQDLEIVSTIQSFKMSRFLYRIALSIAWRLEIRRRKRIIQKTSSYFDN